MTIFFVLYIRKHQLRAPPSVGEDPIPEDKLSIGYPESDNYNKSEGYRYIHKSRDHPTLPRPPLQVHTPEGTLEYPHNREVQRAEQTIQYSRDGTPSLGRISHLYESPTFS